MRAAFPYYIQGLLRPRVRLRQPFRLAASDVTSRLLSGGRRTRAPTIRRSSGCYAFLQDRGDLCRSRSKGSTTGRVPRSEGRVLCADPPPQAAEAPKSQPWPSGGHHSSRHATPARRLQGGVLEGRLGASAWPGPGEQGSGGVEEAARRGRRHRGASLAEEESLSGRGSAGPAPLGGLGLLGSAGRRPELPPGPPGSPGAGRRRWGARRKEAALPSSPRSLPELALFNF